MGRYTRSVSGITQCSFAERIRFEIGRTMDVVITTAISGDNTRGPLAGFDWRVAKFDPDVVFVMIGMNDCSEGNDISVEEFESNLTQLTERMAEVGAIPILQTTCPYWEGQGLDRSPFVDDIQVIRKLARSLAHPLIDHTRFWGDQNAFALMLSLSRQLDDAAHARAHPPQHDDFASKTHPADSIRCARVRYFPRFVILLTSSFYS